MTETITRKAFEKKDSLPPSLTTIFGFDFTKQVLVKFNLLRQIWSQIIFEEGNLGKEAKWTFEVDHKIITFSGLISPFLKTAQIQEIKIEIAYLDSQNLLQVFELTKNISRKPIILKDEKSC